MSHSDPASPPQAIADEYRERTPASREMHERLRRSLPGGETRSVTYYAPYPLAIRAGEGAELVDLDGNRYLDVLNNYTALVHGHAFPPIVEALQGALTGGTAFPASHPRQLELAELICHRYPAAQLVRFTNSGTEAAILALRVARRATGRRRIVLFDGAYHGTAPDFVDPGPDCRRVPYNDLEALRPAVDDSVAAVFAEPFLGSGGVIPAEPSFLRGIEQCARAAGAVFVLDEVQSLRNSYHGLHGELGLKPDLLLMGKIIGGGLPVGAVGGRADLMGLTAADRPGALMHAGTFNGNVLTCAAGIASLGHLDERAIAHLNASAAQLGEQIEAAGAEVDMPVTVTRAGSIMQVHMESGDGKEELAQAALHLALLLEGVFAAPRGMLNLSTALSAAQLEAVAGGYARALARLGRALVSAGGGIRAGE
jgi:glutamate-1-semialdehyde 2,1-aminomutase